jgi:hypothetical protein
MENHTELKPSRAGGKLLVIINDRRARGDRESEELRELVVLTY